MPSLEQVRPFLAEPLESNAGGLSVEHLGGDVLFDHVSFRYDPDGPLILDDISIHAHPGEFVAIAGESGAGKVVQEGTFAELSGIEGVFRDLVRRQMA